MNLKRIFGTILTVLGIAGLIYTAYSVMQGGEGIKGMIVYGVIGLIFFLSGISLVRTTKDES